MSGQIDRHTDHYRSPDNGYVIKVSEFKWSCIINKMKILANFGNYALIRPLCLKKNIYTQLIHVLAFSILKNVFNVLNFFYSNITNVYQLHVYNYMFTIKCLQI